MLRRTSVAVGAALLLTTVAACGSGSKSGDDAKTSGLKEVSFSGTVGKEVKPTWKSKVALPKSSKVTTVVQGKGEKIAKGDTVSAYLWVADGSTKKEAFSDYKNGSPEQIPYNSQLSPLFGKLIAGATYGSRRVAVTNATDLFGQSASQATQQLGISAKSGIVVVADLVKKAPTSPTPSDDKAHDVSPDKLPKIVEKKNKPTGLDWTGIAKPALDTPVQRAVLKKGTGPAVKATDTITVNYLGETYKADTPFDESYSKGQPLSQPLSGLIKGWSIALTGVNVGSRVLIQIPPLYGYGAQGGGQAIPPNATLWFVIDITDAKAGQ